MNEPTNGNAPRRPGRMLSQAGRLARLAETLRAEADAFTASAASDGGADPTRARALHALAQELQGVADEVARVARDLEEP